MLGRLVSGGAGLAPGVRVVDALHRWRGRDASLDARCGPAILIGTLTRSAPATATDRLGVVYTAPPHFPRWEVRDLLARDRREALGLRLSSDDWMWDAPSVPWRPTESTMAVSAIESGTAAAAGAALYYWGRDDQTGARCWLEGDGTSYRFVHHNGSSQVASPALPGPAPTVGTWIRVLGQLRADGAVRCWLALGTAEEVQESAWSAPLALAAAWGAGARWRANRRGSAGPQGSTVLLDLWHVLRNRRLDELEQV
jgi:hypothetical protein